MSNENIEDEKEGMKMVAMILSILTAITALAVVAAVRDVKANNANKALSGIYAISTAEAKALSNALIAVEKTNEIMIVVTNMVAESNDFPNADYWPSSVSSNRILPAVWTNKEGMEMARKTRWLGSPVVEHWNQTGSSSWETVGSVVFGKISFHDIEIGLKPDGTVVWRSKK